MMKKYFFLLMLCYISTPIQLTAQWHVNSKPYQVWVYPMNDSPVIKGFLYEFRDASILVGSTPKSSSRRVKTYDIDITGIQQLAFRKKGKVSSGAWAGLLLGTGLGVGLGFLGGDDLTSVMFGFSRPARIAVFGTAFGIAGTIAGGVLSGPRIQFEIGGSQEQYKRKRSILKDHFARF